MISKLVSFIVGILLFLFSSLTADFHVGAIGGVNFADLDAYVDGRSKTTDAIGKGCGGVLLDLDLTEYFVLRCTPMFVPKGGNILDALRDIEGVEMEVSSTYLELPILIKTNHDNPLHLYFFGGPTFSYLLNSEAKLDIFFPTVNDEVSFETDMMDVTKRLDIGIGIGWGFKIPLNNFDVFAEMRYVRGLTNGREEGNIVLEGSYQGQEITEEVTLYKEENKFAIQGLQLLLGVTLTL